jgi:hypothetical protein
MVMKSSFSKLPIHRDELAKIKQKALRHRIWFKVLSKIERIQIDLTIRLVERVKSSYLAKVLFAVVKKLFDALESPVKRLMREVGAKLAYKISQVGKRLGHKSAEKWAEDQGFIQFLTVTYMNAPVLYK